MENTVSFQEYLLSKGYLFDPKIIENYLLSIKVKPFVIFTGNSGTGKTKLSQLFAEYISDSTQNSGNNSSLINDNEFLSVKVPVNKSSFENTGWTLSNKYLYDVLMANVSETNQTSTATPSAPKPLPTATPAEAFAPPATNSKKEEVSDLPFG